MIKWLVGAGLRFSGLVVAVASGILGAGLFQLHRQAVVVYPEFAPPDIQIEAEALGMSAQEVEQLITVPLEQDLLNRSRRSSTSDPGRYRACRPLTCSSSPVPICSPLAG
jgi:Cu/Ag efflux pump CusA